MSDKGTRILIGMVSGDFTHPGVQFVDGERKASGIEGPAKVGDQQVGGCWGHAVEGDHCRREDSQQGCDKAHPKCRLCFLTSHWATSVVCTHHPLATSARPPYVQGQDIL